MRLPGRDAATAAGGNGSDRPNVVEFSRSPCEDGYSGSCRDGAGETRESRGVGGWTGTGLDAASRIRQKIMQPVDIVVENSGCR